MSERKENKTEESAEAEKLAWQTPVIEEIDYAATEAIPSPGPALIDGIFYTH